MDLLESDSGDLFILLNTSMLNESIVARTSEDLLIDFFANEITLGDLLALSPDPFAALHTSERSVRIYLPDADVQIQQPGSFCIEFQQQDAERKIEFERIVL